MKFDDDSIKKILLEGSYVAEEDLLKAEKYAKAHRGSFMDYLQSEGFINNDIIGQAIAESLHVPFSDLATREPSKEQVLLIPEDIAKKFRVVVFDQKDSEVTLATDDPNQEHLLEIIQPPVKDGFVTLEELRADPDLKKVKVLITSSLEQPEDKDRVAKFGVSGFFNKKNIQEIVEATAKLVG